MRRVLGGAFMVESLAGVATDIVEDGIPTPQSVCHKIPPHSLGGPTMETLPSCKDGSLNH
jgi:hypothetical protein